MPPASSSAAQVWRISNRTGRCFIIKLLIVDDENLTRTGLKSSIDWMSLGIDEVFLAEDGVSGFHEASVHQPDIILSDVRMPRMSGIEMLEKIRAILPDTVFIFMSGYSDKEYLKAAIRLQAVSYVEKPLDTAEVADAVREAVSRSAKIALSHHAQTLSDTISAGHLALCLTLPYRSQKESIRDLSQQYCRKYGSADLFHAAATLLLEVDSRTELDPGFLSRTETALHDRIRTNHMHVIAAEKKTNFFVFHIFRKESFTANSLASAADVLAKSLPEDLPFYIACGSVVSGLSRLYDSYSAAVICLQHCFFREPGTILVADTFRPEKTGSSPDLESLFDAFQAAVKSADAQALGEIMDKLHEAIYENDALMGRSVQNYYYRMAAAVLEQRKVRQLPASGSPDTMETSLDAFGQSFSYPELHRRLQEMIRRYLDDIANYVPENSSVYLIKNYIRQHYTNPLLSTKEISDYASLSASYACTIFKNETGQTLNQYLTEYRLERAKELLADPRNNISEVAARVGYNDSNYFGKAFKKYAGLSPSEYRESRN